MLGKANRTDQSQRSVDALKPLREQLVALLRGGHAHVTFDDAIANVPEEQRGVAPKGLEHSAWQILEHLRIAQRDILDFSVPPTGGYQPMQWPDDYWPKSPVPQGPRAWEQSIAAIRKDQETFESLILNPDADLYKPFRWGEGQNLLREALLIADHNAYHLGELIFLRRLLGIWNK
ncbi:hypothetical protein GCM10011507_10720 [Edaphobacter acidisoli]|uniref:DinB-like domain-containing protein n=1 Tax=Edaphobacter acidisoli TaxID=2040573 RepID=A0A916RKT9_9BACT|nr:DinB family protein [Edaphobacter acidisoli]GGA61073.1 hypothetical protein GCM10011507_10720 [Edaphobacter acidisoli]